MKATWRRFFQGGSAGEGKISKTDSRANSVEVQCEACPLNQVEVGAAVRIKKLCASHDIQVRLLISTLINNITPRKSMRRALSL